MEQKIAIVILQQSHAVLLRTDLKDLIGDCHSIRTNNSRQMKLLNQFNHFQGFEQVIANEPVHEVSQFSQLNQVT
jgi:hypothetical protein